jgi:hypothetical protein
MADSVVSRFGCYTNSRDVTWRSQDRDMAHRARLPRGRTRPTTIEPLCHVSVTRCFREVTP